MSTWLPFLAAAGLLAQGCGGAGASGPGTARVRDSAGITIVENPDPGPNPPAWAAVDSLEADIGGDATDVVYDLNQVTGAVRLADGRLAVANGSTSDVRYYDAEGMHLKTMGRRGDGPGEYQQPMGLWLVTGDSVVVFDGRLFRLTVLDPEGNTARSYGLNRTTGLQTPAGGRMALTFPSGMFADGTALGANMSFDLGQPRGDASYRDTVVHVRFARDGAPLDTVGGFPGPEMRIRTMSFGGQSFPAPTQVPLGRNTVVAAVGDRLLVADNDRFEIQVRDLSGKLTRIIRMASPPRALTEQDAAAHRREQLEAVEENPAIRQVPDAMVQQMRDAVTEAEYPATLPLLTELTGDGTGNIWVQELAAPGTQVRHYAVFDADGAFLGRVTLPEGLRPTWIDATHVVGVWTDADGLQHVRSYRYRRGG